MSKKVDRWLGFGRERCKKNDHWFVLDYGKYLLCPICGQKKTIERGETSEYNCWIVTDPKMVKEISNA